MSVRTRTPRPRHTATLAAILVAVIGFAAMANAQPMTGVYTVPDNYPTLAAAINDANARGVGAGGAQIYVLAGNPQTAPAGGYVVGGSGSLLLTSTSESTPLQIVGFDNTITASNAQTAGALNDAIFKLIGADYIKIIGFTLQENAANTVITPASNTMTEWGVALLYVTQTDGAQNNTIQGNTISMNRTYTNSFGVYSNVRHSPTAVATAADVTAATGANHGNKIYGNTISNVNLPICFVGSTTVAYMDQGNDIGGGSTAAGNTITNWGGAAAGSGYISVSGTIWGIYANNQIRVNVSNNALTSAALASATTTRGIFVDYTGTSPTGTFTNNINNNTVTVTNSTSSTFEMIRNQGIGTANASATIHIDGNTVASCSTPGSFIGVANSCVPGTLTMDGNVVRNIALSGTTSAFTGVQNSGAVVTSISLSNNQIGNAAGGAVTYSVASSGALYGVYNSGGAATAALSMTGNDIRGITNSVAASGAHNYLYNGAATLTQNISNNTFTNLSVNTTGTTYFIYNSVTSPTGGGKTVNNNSIVTAYNRAGASGSVYGYYNNASSVAGTTEVNNNNNFSYITVAGTSTLTGWQNTDGGSPAKTAQGNTFTNWTAGTGAVIGMNINYGTSFAVNQNTVTGITAGGAITGIQLGSSLTLANVTQNTIGTLASTGASTVQGITSASTTSNIVKNRIYDLSASNAAPTGVYGAAVTAGTTVTLANNLIGDLRAPAASSTSDLVRGVNLTSTTSTSNLNLYYNTIYLNAASTGANFSATGLYHTTSATATTAALNLRDNIIVNLSTPNGTGIAAAYRRSSTTLTNYGSGSNANLFYAGAPAANRLVFYDGTNSDQTLAAFKTRVSPRELLSLTENPPFLSTAGTNPSFLHIDPAVPTQLESAGLAIAGYTDDYDGDTRAVATPDLGADEGGFTLADLSGPTISYTPLGNDTGLASRYAGSIVISDPSLVDGNPGTRPRLYYKRSVDANAYNDNSSATDGWKYVEANGDMSPFDFTILYYQLYGPVGIGSVIQYFVVAQDLATPANVAINAGSFAVQPASVDLTAAAFPIGSTLRSYTIVDMPLSGDYVVSASLFSELTGTSLTFERKVTTVTRTVLEPEDQQPQMSGDKSSDEVFLADHLSWKPVERQVEEISWVPMTGGREYSGPLYIKRSENPDLPVHALSGAYATITAAVADLNARGVSGPVRFLLADATYPSETLPITVNVASSYVPTAMNTVAFKPAAGVTSTVTGLSASSAIFKVLGTSYVTIDGSNSVEGTSRDLTLENTSTTSPNVVWFGSSGTTPISGGALKNCVVRNGANTSSAVVVSDGTTAGNAGYFSNLEVRNNQIEKAYIGIYANGGTTPAGGAGLTYADNTLNAVGANAVRLVGLYMQGVNGATVSGNVIGNLEGATGENDMGIWLASGSINAQVTGNTVSNLVCTNTGAYGPIGINVTSGVTGANVNVAQNTVTNISTTGSTAVRGIASPVTGTADIVIQRNVVSGVANNNTGTYGAYGIDLAAGNNHVVRNNVVSDVKFNMQGGAAFSTTFGVFGIRVGSGTGHVIAANSVNLYGALPGTANSSLLTAALGVAGTTSTGCDIRDNLLANTISGGTTSLAHVSAFLPSGGTSTLNLNWNNNAYYCGTTAASQGIAQVGTTAGSGFYLPGNFDPANTTPATNLRAYTSTLSASGLDDNASLASSAAAPFLTPTDLHVRTDMLTPVSNAGVTVSGVFDDIDGDLREATPDIGADEFTIYTLNVVTVGSGSVSVAPAQTAYPAGAVVTLTATAADACQAFAGWSGDAAGTDDPLTLVMDGDKNVTATFVPATYTITATAGIGGAISPSGDVTVACGADQTFTITPESCYDILDVLVDGSSVGAVASYTFTGVVAGHTIAASFAPKSYLITASAGAGGAIDPAGAVGVLCGADQAFTITPDACHDVLDVLVDGVSAGAVTTYTFTGVNAAHTIEALFALKSFTITATAGAGGSISPSGAVAVACGADQTFTITAEVGQNIVDVLVDGVSVGAVGTYTFTGVSANHTIEASFSTVIFTITATAGAGGAIAPAGAVTVAFGTDQTFAITPEACYDVLDVLVDGVSVGAVASYAFTGVSANHTIAASFALKSFTITASAGVGGTISPSGAVVVGCGSDQTFTIAANAGLGVLDVLVDGVSVGAVTSYTFTGVAANHTIAATFVDTLCPEVTVLSPNGGEELVIGVAVDLTWTATDNTGVTCVDLLLSRTGVAGTFETLATCVPNSGIYSWTVTTPATDHAIFKVVAHDEAGNACEDVSDAEFKIVEEAVATLLSRFEASPAQQGVEVRWQLSGALSFARTSVERSDDQFGAYVKLEQTVTLLDGDNVLVDDTAEIGQTYWYRLSGVTRSGQTITFEPVSTKAGVPVVEFALRIAGANPTRDVSRISFAVPRASHVRVTVVDLQGRRVATLADGVFNAGRYEAAWDGTGEKGRMASGMYMIRLEAPGANLIQRVTFLH